ncbi:MAG: DMT family transporter [Oscillospiraceae bacterium]
MKKQADPQNKLPPAAEKAQLQKKNERWATAGILLITVIWGWGFVFSRMALNAGLGPAGVMFGRFGLAAVLIGLVFFKDLRRQYRPGQWKSGLLIGVFLFLGFYLQILGLERTTPANNAFITATYVVLVPLLWWAITKRRPRNILFVASVLSLVGVAVLSVDPSAGFSASLGDGLTLLSALMFACQIVATGILARTMAPSVLVFMQMLVAGVLSFLLFVLVERDFSGFANLEGAASVLYLGILSTCVCYFIQTIAQRHLSSAKAGILLATESLFGALFSVLVGYDQFSVRMVVGGTIMFASMVLPELGRPPAATPPEDPPTPPGREA